MPSDTLVTIPLLFNLTGPCLSVMKQLLRKPFLLSLILSLPLWIGLKNYIVAFCVALLVAFLLSMIDSIIAINKQRRTAQHLSPHSPVPDQHTPEADSDPHA